MGDPISNAEFSEALAGSRVVEPSRSTLEAAITSEIVIDFKDVSISFNGRSILQDVNFSVGRTQTLCIWAVAAWASQSLCAC